MEAIPKTNGEALRFIDGWFAEMRHACNQVREKRLIQSAKYYEEEAAQFLIYLNEYPGDPGDKARFVKEANELKAAFSDIHHPE